MPANRTNYLVLYNNCSQVYAAGKKEIALSTPPPEGYTIEDKHVLFISVEPETQSLVVRELPRQEVLTAELIEKKPKKKKEE